MYEPALSCRTRCRCGQHTHTHTSCALRKFRNSNTKQFVLLRLAIVASDGFLISSPLMHVILVGGSACGAYKCMAFGFSVAMQDLVVIDCVQSANTHGRTVTNEVLFVVQNKVCARQKPFIPLAQFNGWDVFCLLS